MEINNNSLKQFRNEFNAAVEELAKKHNVKIDLGAIRYDDNSFTSKIVVTNTVTASGITVSEHFKWNQECRLVGLEPGDFNAAVTVNGMKGKLVGIKPRSFKYPIIVEAVDGKRYKMSVSQVKSRLVKV